MYFFLNTRNGTREKLNILQYCNHIRRWWWSRNVLWHSSWMLEWDFNKYYDQNKALRALKDHTMWIESFNWNFTTTTNIKQNSNNESIRINTRRNTRSAFSDWWEAERKTLFRKLKSICRILIRSTKCSGTTSKQIFYMFGKMLVARGGGAAYIWLFTKRLFVSPLVIPRNRNSCCVLHNIYIYISMQKVSAMNIFSDRNTEQQQKNLSLALACCSFFATEYSFFFLLMLIFCRLCCRIFSRQLIM